MSISNDKCWQGAGAKLHKVSLCAAAVHMHGKHVLVSCQSANLVGFGMRKNATFWAVLISPQRHLDTWQRAARTASLLNVGSSYHGGPE